MWSVSCHIFHIFLLLVIFLFKMAPKCSTEVLSSVPKEEETVIRLKGNICVSKKLCSGMSYIAVGNEFNVSESTMY